MFSDRYTIRCFPCMAVSALVTRRWNEKEGTDELVILSSGRLIRNWHRWHFEADYDLSKTTEESVHWEGLVIWICSKALELKIFCQK